MDCTGARRHARRAVAALGRGERSLARHHPRPTATSRRLALGTGLVVIAATGGLFGADRAAASGAAADPLTLDGHAWSRFSADAREAYLAGFIAGAAAHQVTSARRGLEGAAAAREAARLRQAGALDFPYATNVYRSHLDDWYFYRNRRQQTLLEVLVEMNEVSRGPGR